MHKFQIIGGFSSCSGGCVMGIVDTSRPICTIRQMNTRAYLKGMLFCLIIKRGVDFFWNLLHGIVTGLMDYGTQCWTLCG